MNKILCGFSALKQIQQDHGQTVSRIRSMLETNYDDRKTKAYYKLSMALHNALKHEVAQQQTNEKIQEQVGGYLSTSQFKLQQNDEYKLFGFWRKTDDYLISVVAFPSYIIYPFIIREYQLNENAKINSDYLRFTEMNQYDNRFMSTIKLNEKIMLPQEKEDWKQMSKDQTIDPENPFGIGFQQFMPFYYYLILQGKDQEMVLRCSQTLGKSQFNNISITEFEQTSGHTWEQQCVKAILKHNNRLVFDFVNFSDPFQSKWVDFLQKLGLDGKEVYYLELLATQKNQSLYVQWLINTFEMLQRKHLIQ